MSKTEYDLSAPIVELDGEPVKDSKHSSGFFTVASCLSNMLAQSTKGDAVENYDWAICLRKEGKLDLSDSERDRILDFVKGIEYPSIFKAQIIRALKS